MLPTLAEGDYVFALCWWRKLVKLVEGDLIVAQHDKLPFLIKRIKKISSTGTCLLEGDSPQSMTSDQMGEFSKDQIIAKVIYCVRAKNLQK